MKYKLPHIITSLHSSNKKVFTLLVGTFVSQLIPLLFSPVLTRLFSPDDFGMFAVYFSVTQIISVFITARYEMAVILPEKDHKAVNVVALSIVITLIITILSAITVVIFYDSIGRALGNKDFSKWAFSVPIAVLLIGISQTLTNWCNRKERYSDISTSRITRSGVGTFMSMLLALFPFKQAGLILGDLIGQGVAAIYLICRFMRFDREFLKDVNPSAMSLEAKRYNQFPKFNVVSGLLEKVAGHLPTLMLTSFFGAGATGLFALGQRVVSAPSAVMARSIGDVFRIEANLEYQRTGIATGIFNKTLKKLLIISIVPFGALFFFGPLLFSFIFGAEWYEAGEYARIMTVMFFLQFVVSPLSNMFLVAEKQKMDLFLQVFLLILVIAALFAGKYIFDDPRKTILLFSMGYSCKYVVEFILSYRFSQGKHARKKLNYG